MAISPATSQRGAGAPGAGGLGDLLEHRPAPTDPTADRRRLRPTPRPAR
jgi:hypothetical protein